MRTPPFKGLYYFYVAAQQLSLKKAADHLSVSQAAVSQQIKTLEDTLNVTLFRRHHRAISLTPEAERLLPHLASAFDAIRQGVNDIVDDPDPQRITLSVLPSFASRWLIPRLSQFYQAHPDLSVNLSMTDQIDDFSSSVTDAAIRFGEGLYEGLTADALMGDYLYPVCHPSYQEQYGISRIDDLAKVRLLEDATGGLVWERWLEAQSYCDTLLDQSLANRENYDGSHYVIDSALSAHGVALVRHSLAAELVQRGHLVALFDQALMLGPQYHFCAPPHHYRRPKVAAFRTWLIEQASDFTQAGLPPYSMR